MRAIPCSWLVCIIFLSVGSLAVGKPRTKDDLKNVNEDVKMNEQDPNATGLTEDTRPEGQFDDQNMPPEQGSGNIASEQKTRGFDASPVSEGEEGEGSLQARGYRGNFRGRPPYGRRFGGNPLYGNGFGSGGSFPGGRFGNGFGNGGQYPGRFGNGYGFNGQQYPGGGFGNGYGNGGAFGRRGRYGGGYGMPQYGGGYGSYPNGGPYSQSYAPTFYRDYNTESNTAAQPVAAR